MKVKRAFLLICLMFISFTVVAEDTSVVLQLNAQAVRLQLTNPPMAINKLRKALDISMRIGYAKGTMMTYKNIGQVYFQEKKYQESINNYRLALHIAESIYHAYEIASISVSLGKAFNITGDRENALYYLDKAKRHYTIISDTEGLYQTLQTISLVYQSHNEYYYALNYGLEALKISKSQGNNEKMVLSMGNLGQIYALLNQNEKALEYYLSAVSHAEAVAPSAYLPILYIKTGTLYRDNNNWQQAVNYLLKAYGLFSQSGNHDGMIAALAEIGITYKNIRDNNKALNYFLRARTIAEQENNFPRIVMMNKEIADIHIQQKNLPKALVYLDMNFNIAKELQDSRLEAEALMNMGYYYLLSGSPQKAVDLLQQSFSIAKSPGDLNLLAVISGYLAEAYAKTGKFQNAYDQMKLSKQYALDDYSSRESLTYEMLQSVFEITTSEKELELLRSTYEIERLEKEKAISVRNWLLLGLIGLVIVLFVLAYAIIMIRKTNRVLKIKGLEIEASNLALLDMNVSLEKQKTELNQLNNSLQKANEMLKESEERYKLSNATKDKLFSIISHDLRSPFSSVVSFVRILKRDMSNLSKKDISELVVELEDTTNRINTLLENLLQWSMVQRGRISYAPVSVRPFEIINEIRDLFSVYAKNKNITVSNTVSDDVIVYADYSMLSTVFRNLISNALKFSPPDHEVVISGEFVEEQYNFHVANSGKEMSPEDLHAHIFGGDPRIKSGTNDERGSGLGLLICHEFLKYHNSSVNVSKNKQKQTVFSFSLYPVNSSEQI
jgi:signal transduction histidine kinase